MEMLEDLLLAKKEDMLALSKKGWGNLIGYKRQGRERCRPGRGFQGRTALAIKWRVRRGRSSARLFSAKELVHSEKNPVANIRSEGHG